MKKISTKLKGNKANTLESWRFQKGSGKDAKVVNVSERPSFLVTITGKDERGCSVRATKILHSKRVVNSVLKRCGINKPSYPYQSKRHSDDVAFKKKKMNSFIFEKQDEKKVR